MYKKSSGIIDLKDKICLVTGGSRGIGKGIAVQLAYYGATCYVTGRKLETLEKLNKEVEMLGGNGRCIPVQCDHTNDDEVKKLFERVDEENHGKLDLLVNNAYSAVNHIREHQDKKFWEIPPEAWDIYNNVGLRNHYICSVYASRLMIEKRQGLIINISSLGGMQHMMSALYGIGKCAKDRMAQDCAEELKKYKVAFISLWPGLVRTEAVNAETETMTAQFGRHYERAETPTYVGKVVAALLSGPHAEVMLKSGKVVLSTDIGRKYNITTESGIVPTQAMQLNFILTVMGLKKIANFIPDFLRIPLSLAKMIAAYQHS